MSDHVNPDDLWIQTSTGKQVYPARPSSSVVTLPDIAHSLACQSRFAGHTVAPYSVAQHSVLVMGASLDRWIQAHPVDAAVTRANDAEVALVSLMHDAAEAYLQDIVRPIKRALPGDFYRDLEREWLAAIGYALGVGTALCPSGREVDTIVAKTDNVVLATEARDLFHGDPPSPWPIDEQPIPVDVGRITVWPWQVARSRFFREALAAVALYRQTHLCAEPTGLLGADALPVV